MWAKCDLSACFQQEKNALLVTDIVIESVLPSEILLSNYCLLKDLRDRSISCQNPKIQNTKLPTKGSPQTLPKSKLKPYTY